jgi:hypothetical protein
MGQEHTSGCHRGRLPGAMNAMNRKQGKVRVENDGRTFYVEPGPHGAIFEEDSGGMLVPGKGLTAGQAERLRQIAETRLPPRAPVKPGT